MNDEYLWDGSGDPDPDVQHLERLLGRLRSAPPLPALPEPRLGWRGLTPLLATAAAVVLMIGSVWQSMSEPSWEVAKLAGEPRIDRAPVAQSARLRVGESLTTDAQSRARVAVAQIGQVTVEGSTSVRLIATDHAHHRLALDRGTINAFIQAPPGQFVVDTPSATATDLGCVYTLHVDDDGSGLLSVIAGWVAFEFKGRESFVPAGASCRTDPDVGPGTPRFDDADRRWQDALDEIDFGVDPARRAVSLKLVLEGARRRDAVTLWHLLPRVAGSERSAVFDALSARVPPPPGVTRDAVLLLDHDALDRWWDVLGLGDTALWRKWKRAYPAGQASQAKRANACVETPTITAEPPRDPNADPFGAGPWYVNANRTIWARAGFSVGSNKVIWIRPAGTDLKISGTRIDAPAPPLDARIPCCFRSGFQVTGLTFPSAGCWRISATAGSDVLEFTTVLLGDGRGPRRVPDRE